MQKHTVSLTDNEFRLFQMIRGTDQTGKIKNDLIEVFIRQIELFSGFTAGKSEKKWLQLHSIAVGELRR